MSNTTPARLMPECYPSALWTKRARSPASRWSSSASSSRSPSAPSFSRKAAPTSSRWSRSTATPRASCRRWRPARRATSSRGTGASTRCRSTSAIRPPGVSWTACSRAPAWCSPTFAPALAAELALDWASLAPHHPRLVVGNVSAFGRRGPAARLAGMDLVVQARSGLMAAGVNIQDGVPTGGENPVVDYMCAMTLAFGIASALLRRTNTGRGGEGDASLLMSGALIQTNNMVRIESADRAAHTAILARLAEMRATGRPYAEQAALTPQIRPPGTVHVYYRTYATRDAALAVACGSPALRRAFMRTVGLADEALDRPIADREKEVQHYRTL